MDRRTFIKERVHTATGAVQKVGSVMLVFFHCSFGKERFNLAFLSYPLRRFEGHEAQGHSIQFRRSTAEMHPPLGFNIDLTRILEYFDHS